MAEDLTNIDVIVDNNGTNESQKKYTIHEDDDASKVDETKSSKSSKSSKTSDNPFVVIMICICMFAVLVAILIYFIKLATAIKSRDAAMDDINKQLSTANKKLKKQAAHDAEIYDEIQRLNERVKRAEIPLIIGSRSEETPEDKNELNKYKSAESAESHDDTHEVIA